MRDTFEFPDPQPMPQDALPPMIIDSFAGGGGASTGIEMALGRSPDVAINHNPAALALHEANHPDTRHLINSIYAVDPRDVVPKGRRVGLAWFSPDCKHFSKAKGGTPVNKNIRDLAWVVVHWAERVAPDVIMLENVEEFQDWGPVRHRHAGGKKSTNPPRSLDEWKAAPPEIRGTPVYDDKGAPVMEPCPLSRGQEFERWVRALRRLGYKVQWKILRACDYGAPTIRKRLFIIARRDGLPIIWPAPTHDDPASKPVKQGKRKPWRTAAECIDWSVPCPSIFDTSDQIKAKLGITAKRPLAANTLKRIARGMQRYVLQAEEPFIVNTTGHAGYSADQPASTITTGGHHIRVAPSITRFNSGATGQRLDDPLATVTANSFIKRPGGAAPLGLLAPTLVGCGGRAGQSRPRGGNEPMATITAKADTCLVAPSLISVAHGYSGGRREYPLTEPKGTVTSGGIAHALTAPHLLSLKGTSRRDSAAQAPHPTVLAGGGHSALIAPVITYAQHGGHTRDARAPLHTICANNKDQNSLIAATMVQTGYGERSGQAPRALDLQAPLGTIVAGGAKHAPVAAFLTQHNSARDGVNPGRPADAPISTLTASGSHQNLVAPWFAKYYGTGDGARTDEPCHTITVRDRMGHVEAELQAPEFGPEHHDRARQVAEFLRAHDAWDGGEFVTLTIDGAEYVVADIGMRMLTPRELFNAQGFPPDYVIEGIWRETDGDWTFEPFTKSVQVSCCGNSVCPDLAAALARANCAHLAEQEVAA
ncbi:DNA cytosine methyltransferase [Mameliella alba]|nr:DNA cytosine methyltransferase [Mameliella alba]